MSVQATVSTALIGGTSLLESALFHDFSPRHVATPYGDVTLMQRDSLIFLQRHGATRYTPPHRINHLANLSALQQVSARRILAIGSVGSMRHAISPGTLIVPDDFYAPHLGLTFFDDHRGHQAPGFHPGWRQELLDLCEGLGIPPLLDAGTYWQTVGPRFETPVEIRVHQPHCHVVGMTIASECILAGELGIPYAALCMVDNYANGVAEEAISYELFKSQVRDNEQRIEQVIKALLPTLSL